MTTVQLCPDDLLLAARRGELSLQDDARLAFHLKSCPRCRIALETGRSFDAVLCARVGDDEIATRIAARLTQQRTRTWAPWALGVGVLLSASLAVAEARMGVIRSLFSRPDVATASPMSAKTTLAKSRPSEPLPGPELPLHAAPLDAPALRATVSEVRSGNIDLTQAKEPPRSPSSSSPGELFAEANLLRSGGKSKEAERRYAELQARFPGSTEARVSLVSLARLELGKRPGQALRHFDAYLAQSAHTTLAEEAMFGRASSLGRLGRTPEEQAAWRDLLKRYPSSVYAERARNRLAAMP